VRRAEAQLRTMQCLWSALQVYTETCLGSLQAQALEHWAMASAIDDVNGGNWYDSVRPRLCHWSLR